MRASAAAVRLPFVLLAIVAARNAAAQGLPRARPEDVGLSVTALRRIDPQLPAWVKSDTVAVVVRHGKIAYVAQAGSLDSTGRQPIAEDAVFRIYSMTKPLT
jgi:CubicO group peptidase (beta-lactamase class C family)